LEIMSVFLDASGWESTVLISKSEMRDDFEYQVTESPLGRSSAQVIIWQSVGTVASCRCLARFASDFDGLIVRIRHQSGPT
jgi:hypothetical protein